jgi:hypothetical protein
VVNESLRAKLLASAEEDQAHARAVYEASQRHEPHRGRFLFDIPQEEWLPEYTEPPERKERRAAELRAILAEHGWPGRSLVGNDGCRAAWLIAQHGSSEPAFRAECEAALATAVEAGEARPGQLAALRDRMELEAGRPQLYGTHLEPDGDGWRAVRGLVDEVAVDLRRSQLGLKPWRQYLADCMNGTSET